MKMLTVGFALATIIVISRAYPLHSSDMIDARDVDGISDMVADNPYFRHTQGYYSLNQYIPFPFNQRFSTPNNQNYNTLNGYYTLNDQGINTVNSQAFTFYNNQALNSLNNNLNQGSYAYNYLLNDEIEQPEYNYQYY